MRAWLRRLCFSASKRKVALFLTLLIGSVAFVSLFSSLRQPPHISVNNDSAAHTALTVKLQKDSDGDGLKDWEEVIFHTDPKNSDTDGDGTPDGEEIKQGRDPLKPGPDDRLATTTLAALADNAPGLKFSDNFTSAIAEQFGERVIIPSLKNQDGTASIDKQKIGADLADQVASAIVSLEREVQQAAVEGGAFIKSDNDSASALITYLQASSAATKELLLLEKKLETTIFTDALDKEDFSGLQELDLYLIQFDQTVRDLKTIKVPPSLATLHLRYITLTIKQYEAVKKIRTAETDLIGALAGARIFLQAQDEAVVVVREFQQILKKRKIAF
ncbi:MAG: hypothetical protein Q8Q94_01785 [bacterium]|nr:hypothetical protein [bacterium]MDZ4299475.1 hypothetical protein [Candidatus Sungbacteria bacterium]